MNYQEYKQSLNQRLTDKVQREFSAFREEMLGKPSQKVKRFCVGKFTL